ncbi:MAG: manganese efflux pump MntP family protein [Thermoguttaceae bacterium]|jgi:putative Mn2+ efflux pump MntP
MDAFAVAIAAGLVVAPVTPRHVFRLAFHFGLFQFLMPLAGWCAGRSAARFLAGYGPIAACALLVLVGGKMLWDARSADRPETRRDPTRGISLVTLSLATSIDALAAGMSMALAAASGRGSIWILCAATGLTAAGMTALGLDFGARLGPRWKHGAELIGGVLLLLIGASMLLM